MRCEKRTRAELLRTPTIDAARNNRTVLTQTHSSKPRGPAGPGSWDRIPAIRGDTGCPFNTWSIRSFIGHGLATLSPMLISIVRSTAVRRLRCGRAYRSKRNCFSVDFTGLEPRTESKKAVVGPDRDLFRSESCCCTRSAAVPRRPLVHQAIL